MTPKRNSIAFFSNFNLGQIIDVLPGVGEAIYEPVESEAYLVSVLLFLLNREGYGLILV